MLVFILSVVMALVVGLGVGYATSVPQQNSLKDARDKARVELTKAKSNLATANNDLAATKSNAAKMSAARDTCKTAATDARDLIGQWENFMADLQSYFSSPVGSAAEASVSAHMNDQANKMGDQSRTVERETTACEAAIS